MGGPGVYEPMLPDVPDELATVRTAHSGYLRAKHGVAGDRYRRSYRDLGHSIYEMMEPPDFLADLIVAAIGYLSEEPGATQFDKLEAILDGYYDEDGYPVQLEDWYIAAKAQVAFDLEESAYKINEAAIISGSRYGTGIARAHAKEIARKTADLGVAYAKLVFDGLTQARNRELTAVGLGVELAKVRASVRSRWIGGLLGAGVDYWRTEITRNQIAFMEWQGRQYEYRPAYKDIGAYANSYPFQSHAPTVTPNPMMQLLQGVIGAGAQVAAAALTPT